MAELKKETTLLQEWIVANARIDNIDARIWQGAGILLVISIGGFSIVNWNPPRNLSNLVTAFVTASIALGDLFSAVANFS